MVAAGLQLMFNLSVTGLVVDQAFPFYTIVNRMYDNSLGYVRVQ